MTRTTQPRTPHSRTSASPSGRRYTFRRGLAAAVLVTNRALTGGALPQPVPAAAAVVAGSLA